ncbi:pullulanase-type alpha-1,6-glucosidase [Pseudoduganella namucuonensis]|uniref:pullulanase n=1 Tax=Pseudoduganella namucuonensis TaxID=1035707 RepID=A0A1I7IME4_9BURK|nr:pullulanase-type alpha-1,6-glucosidase [Pseudoduganella namucuonensis]SFU74103.1 alpha-1,6-glucosidases, pullulanase-type [Pseudoduganella namucuonensis]
MRIHCSFSSKTLPAIVVCGALTLLAGCGAGGGDGAAGQPPKVMGGKVQGGPALAPATIRMHFHRTQNDAAQWGVYSWDGPLNPSSAWIADRFMMTGGDAFGGYVDIPVNTAKSAMWFLVTDGSGNKNCGSDQSVNFSADIAAAGQEVWMLEGDCTVYPAQPPVSFGNLNQATAHWLSASTLAWPGVPSAGSYKLYYAANGGLGSDTGGVTGADGSMALTPAAALPDALKQKYPHLAAATALTLSASDAASVADKASGQFAVAQFDAAGKLVQVTSLQAAGMLDDVFAPAAASANLGLSFDQAGVPTFRVWAPTAKSVSLTLYPDASSPSTLQMPMTRDAASGVWSYTSGGSGWTNRYYYTYNVKVLSRWANNTLVSNTVTDPYSLSVNANSQRSFVANLDSRALKPDGWDNHAIPRLAHPADISLYELHVRDFSAGDSTVPAERRGKYLAFTERDSNGMRHLKGMQAAGLTHIHLLPAFDFASVNESGCATPAIPAAAANSELQQAAVEATRGADCFNWGYDPVHYTTPEGSYSSNANDGAVRVREFRSMVQSLHEQGLRVTMDVVYNHTSASQQGPLSVLDKIVPAYYYRMNSAGGITNDSCCADTAQENAMMAKLMIDSAATWARDYKIDSFRFDIMGFTPLAVMNRLQAAVNAAAKRDIYIYGEAWNFGAVGNDARFVQARQANMFGSGIGSFNDRLRDAVRGGGCCDGGEALVSQQGFINGVFYDPNAKSTQSKDDLLRLADLVRVGLSGTLRDYSFTDRTGAVRKNSEIDYFGQKAGFAANPAETINYVEAHDNQTLFDLNAFKLPANTSLADRVRVQNLGAAINVLSQGVPFLHAGQEILRSKSLDRDSYDAGDWFNRLDYGYQSNNFGVGLPMAGVNRDNWSLMSPVLANPLIKPDRAAIIDARDYMNDLLAIRADSTLFRLRTAGDVAERLRFHNTGPLQVAGVVAMSIDGQHPSRYDGAKYKSVLVLFNVDKVARTVTLAELRGRKLKLHKVQRKSESDRAVRNAAYNGASGAFTIPPRTTAVFVENAAHEEDDD